MESTAVVKAFALLEASAAKSDGLGLGELAALVGLNKPTAHRLLKTLAGLGYMEKCGFGRYRQTPQVRRLVGDAEEHRLLVTAAPHIARLHAETQETINLAVLRSGRIVYLEVHESPQPLRRVATPHSTDPFHSTALGRAIVAFLPESQRELLLRSKPWESRTARTIVDPKAFRAVLEQVARDGYAVERDETDLGVTCLGAPILDGGLPVAAVSISLPSARSTADAETRLVAALRSTVKRIENQITKSQASIA